MNSPVSALFKKLIEFDKSNAKPVYVQVAQQIINLIQRGYITKGTLLPGTRILSKVLAVHRNTAVAIYDELASQGWVEIQPNKGTFVLFPEQNITKIKAASYPVSTSFACPEETGFAFQKTFHLASTAQATQAKYVINDGKPDLRLHPTYQFSRWYSAAMKRKSLIKKWNRTDESLFSVFEAQLSNYLNATRGFHIKPGNILSTRSTEMSLYVVSQLLLKPGDVVLVGQLSNYTANMIFQQAGASIKTVPVDGDGLDVDYIKTHFIKGGVRCVYLCAQRDYPTTVTLSADRRLKLLHLAKTFGFAVIEDDFDYDFQYEGSAKLPLASADASGHVIYLGKLGQSLFPSFQTGFVVAPDSLISEAKNYLQLLDQQGDLIQKQMFAELISEGEIYRLIKKNSLVYKQRRDCLCEELKICFGDAIQWDVPSGGLAIWLRFKPEIPLVKLAEVAEIKDVFIPKTILYQDRDTCAIRFGFGHLEEVEIKTVVKTLKASYDAVINESDIKAPVL